MCVIFCHTLPQFIFKVIFSYFVQSFTPPHFMDYCCLHPLRFRRDVFLLQHRQGALLQTGHIAAADF